MKIDKVQTPISLFIAPHWKYSFKEYEKAVANKSILDADYQKLKKLRFIAIFIPAVFFSILLAYFGASPMWLFEQIVKGSGWTAIIPACGLLIYLAYTRLLNWQVPLLFKVPDQSKFVKTNETLDVRRAPDPRPDGFFPLGITEDGNFIDWKFGTDAFRSNLVMTGYSNPFVSEIVNAIIRGAIGANPNTVFLIYDLNGGLDFSWLRHDFRSLLEKKIEVAGQRVSIESIYSDDKLQAVVSSDTLRAEIDSVPPLPNIAVFDESNIDESLEWLNSEYERRLLNSKLPNFKTKTQIVVIMDWELTALLVSKNTRYQILRKLAQADHKLKINFVAVANPVTGWQSFNDLQPFISSLQFFSSAHNEQPKEKGEKGAFVSRTVDIAPVHYTCKLWWKGSPQIISMLKCDSMYLAEYVYIKASESNPETTQLWKCAYTFRPFSELQIRKNVVVNNLAAD